MIMSFLTYRRWRSTVKIDKASTTPDIRIDWCALIA
jgi:hypothetical protein